jgi:hypothetical protein
VRSSEERGKAEEEMNIKKRIFDWWHGWSEPKQWERDALGLIEVLSHEGRTLHRSHPSDPDCWCSVCCMDKADLWINEYWDRRLNKSKVKAEKKNGALVVSDK